MNDENVKKWAEENNFENDSQIMRYHLDRLYEITKKVGFARTQVWNEAEGFESADTDEMDKRVRDRKILSEQLLEWIALLLLTLLKSRAVSICLMLYGKV